MNKFLVFFLAFSLAACSSGRADLSKEYPMANLTFETPPSWVIEALRDYLSERNETSEGNGSDRAYRLDNIDIFRSKQLGLEPRDIEEKIQEKWCIAVTTELQRLSTEGIFDRGSDVFFIKSGPIGSIVSRVGNPETAVAFSAQEILEISWERCLLYK